MLYLCPYPRSIGTRLVPGVADAYATPCTNQQKGEGAMEDVTKEEQALMIFGIVLAVIGILLSAFGFMSVRLGQAFTLALASILIVVTVSILSR